MQNWIMLKNNIRPAVHVWVQTAKSTVTIPVLLFFIAHVYLWLNTLQLEL